MSKSRWVSIAVGSTLLIGCAHSPSGKGIDAERLLGLACSPGTGVKSLKGSVWMKVTSKEASGQFPAYVTAQDPDVLRLDVTNLIGGTEAIITVQGQHYNIQGPNKTPYHEQGSGSWGGIPLQWASLLFLGKIPCPTSEALTGASRNITADGDLKLETRPQFGKDAEEFVYRFKSWGGEPWPESLRWERKGISSMIVNFKFDDPEDQTHSPKRWEAKSDRGEVKVRWKEREVSR